MQIRFKKLNIIIFATLLFWTSVANAITVEITAIVPGCGDGEITDLEQCDNSNLGGATCSSLGFISGILSCSTACTFNTSLCSNTPISTHSSHSGGSTSSLTPSTNIVLSGRAYPKSTVTLLKDAQVVATTIAGKDANFQATVSGVSGGDYLFSAYAKDNSGSYSSLLTFPIKVTSPATTKVSGIYISPSVSLQKVEINRGENIVVFGQSVPLSNIEISISGDTKHLVKTTSNLEGLYTTSFNTSILKAGDYKIKVKYSLDNEESSYSKENIFTVIDKNIKNELSEGTASSCDVNTDGKVNLVDLSIMVYWYRNPIPPAGLDLNGDGVVNLTDLSILMFHWTG